MEKILVIANHESVNEEIYYCGDIELEAYKKFKGIQFTNKKIVKADVKMTMLQGVQFIEKYTIIEKIRG
jgi:hypothetical protein